MLPNVIYYSFSASGHRRGKMPTDRERQRNIVSRIAFIGPANGRRCTRGVAQADQCAWKHHRNTSQVARSMYRKFVCMQSVLTTVYKKSPL